MIDEDKRQAILQFHAQGKGSRWISGAVRVSRTTVMRVLAQGSQVPPTESRPRKLDEHLDLIRDLYNRCERSVVRVGEELEKALGHPVPYASLTSFCRHHRLGKPVAEEPAGRYEFGPGVEMQHDTSPVDVKVGGVVRRYQAASLKLGFSRNRYLRFYRRFRRFECKDCLARGLAFFDGACGRCMIDNTSVIIAYGTGDDAVPAPEMEVFANTYGFRFKAHAKGDANRSAKVERDFDFIQRNFLKGRTFVDDADLNRQAEEWAKKKNAGYDKRAKVWLSRLYEEERAHLKRLPAYRPAQCQWHYHRRVDAEGFVCLDGNRYSAPNAYLGKTLTIKETMDTVTLMDGRVSLCDHPRIREGERGESRLPGHGRHPSRARSAEHRERSTEESWLADRSAVLASYVQGLRRRVGRRFSHQVRKLYALCHEYQVAEVEGVVARATAYDLFDVTRLEGMLLQEYGARLFGFTKPGPGGSTGEGDPGGGDDRGGA
jgi:transposase